jgi:hypothetical protein
MLPVSWPSRLLSLLFLVMSEQYLKRPKAAATYTNKKMEESHMTLLRNTYQKLRHRPPKLEANVLESTVAM